MLTTARFVSCRLRLRIWTLKWTNLTIFSTKTSPAKKSSPTPTSTSRMNSNRNLRSSKMKPSNLKIRSPSSRNQRLSSSLRLLKLSAKFCFGSVRLNSSKKCRKLLTPPLVRLRLLPCVKKFIAWNSAMISSARSRKSLSRTWSAAFSSARPYSLSTCPRLRKRTLRTGVSRKFKLMTLCSESR